ncbi:MAG: exosortase U [Planctomycetes bacterium]|nr:exosortase U [Planctomycetota bacterium]
MSGTTPLSSAETTDLRRWKNPVLLFATAVLLGHAPLAAFHLRSLWQQEQYQYFPFVIAAAIYFLWSRWQQAPDRSSVTSSQQNKTGAALPLWIAAVAVMTLIGAILLVSPWLAFVSLNIGLAAVFAMLGRQRAIPYLWGIWLLLWLLIPLPLGVDNRLITYLQKLSSQLSSAILELLGILHLMSGNVLQLPTKEFFVDEACSGIISVMSMIACAAIYAVWKNRSFAHLIALVLMGVTWALVLNVLRICLIAAVFHFFDYDLSTGAVHEALGLMLFLLMFLALVSTDYLLLLMLSPIDTALLGGIGQENLFVRLWNRTQGNRTEDGESTVAASGETLSDAEAEGRILAWPRMSTAVAWSIPFLILGIVQLIWMPSSDTAGAAQALERALALDDQSLPRTLGPWIRDSFEAVERDAYSDFGKYSRTYRYRHQHNEGVIATVSLDFPYLGGWHDLCMCYLNAGWTIHDRSIESREDPQRGGNWKFVVGELEDSAMGRAFISFAGFDAQGMAAEPAGDAILFRPWFRLRRRLLLKVSPQLFQVQVFASGTSAEDQELRQDLQQLLFDSRVKFRNSVTATQVE